MNPELTWKIEGIWFKMWFKNNSLKSTNFSPHLPLVLDIRDTLLVNGNSGAASSDKFDTNSQTETDFFFKNNSFMLI